MCTLLKTSKRKLKAHLFVIALGSFSFRFEGLRTEGVVMEQFVKPTEAEFTFDILEVLCGCEAL